MQQKGERAKKTTPFFLFLGIMLSLSVVPQPCLGNLHAMCTGLIRSLSESTAISMLLVTPLVTGK